MNLSVQELLDFEKKDSDINIFYLSNSYNDQIILLNYILKYLDYCVNSKRSHSFKPEKTCVFLDIDGTILYTKEQNKQNLDGQNQTKGLKKFYKSITQCTLLLYKIFEKCNQLGIIVFLITARTETPEIRNYTKQQLESCGYHDLYDLSQKANNKQSVKKYAKEQQKIFQQHNHIKSKKPFYHELIMLPLKVYEQLSQTNDFNFSAYKFESRQYLIKKYKVVPLLCIGDQWYDVIHIPKNWNLQNKKNIEKQKEKQVLHFIHTKIIPSSNINNHIYIMTGVDISWLSIKLSMTGIH